MIDITPLQHPFQHESRFDALLCPYRKQADRVMLGMCLFLAMVCLALSPVLATWLEWGAIALPTTALAGLFTFQHPGKLITRLYMGCAFMAFTGLIIHQTGGTIEAHFSAFGLIGVLLYYRDWRAIVAATAAIYLHHLILGFAQSVGVPVYVFNSGAFWLTFAIHVAYFLPFIAMMVYLSIWLRREGYENRNVITLANRIMQGHFTEGDYVSSDALKMPLISTVISMKNRLLDLLRIMPVPSAIVRLDTHMIVSVNDAWERTFGPLARRDIWFHDCPIWAESGTWDNLINRLQEAEEHLLDKVELVLQRMDGSRLLCELSLILHQETTPVIAILTVEDVTQRRRAEQTLHRLAFKDMLTDLPNRTSLNEELVAAWTEWQNLNTPFAVIALDLDGFKPINDTYGHDAGDAVLRAVGQRLQAVNRHNDVAGRMGGDEFLIILRGCKTAEQALAIGLRVVENLGQEVVLEGSGAVLRVGASAGIAHSAETGPRSLEDMTKQADQALYAAKRAGKNQAALFGLKQDA
ncbi:diguanylate cyclase [Magnetospirillum gryphiswaldense]|uniref:Sensory box/GGDEF domain protein n=1 Tax=Magnetospirillum gryphiswaldense TaxID=55518 RepID=A4TWI7_9PROT|nr:diguanylate cyclase [Magnetospirillum gryphiswaldense]CAM74994.1 sensory box/GGDEF domain protein [Magnetospirillum gryphiswaldense MSR-1]